MANIRFVHFNSESTFNRMKLSANKENTSYTVGYDSEVIAGDPTIKWEYVIYIKPTRQMWTHGTFYDCSITPDELKKLADRCSSNEDLITKLSNRITIVESLLKWL